uniref:Uncharacterized protein n=1 Tax=Tanacetum cinerariifolium TaxID=118510 RepID=A0A699JMG2_TANCI|nr:hypothetical protein [Tanacetum cinerariifolium]
MQIPEPDDKRYQCNLAQHSSLRLGTLKGCLCVFRHELLPNELWVMKEYNEKPSWEIYGCEREMDGIVHSLRLMKHYIPNKNPLCLDTWFGRIRMFLEACSYVESLVSPHFRKRPKRKRHETSPKFGLTIQELEDKNDSNLHKWEIEHRGVCSPTVRIIAFQAIDPGSTPGKRICFLF